MEITKRKPFEISKWLILEAWKKVKASGGAYGIDKQSIETFESDLKSNLYKIWNRVSSGSYFPPAVKRVDIPKSSGGFRPLGIPTVADRVAQMAVKMILEPVIDPKFHQDSYGYRPGKSAIDAVSTARKRCWRYNWVVDLDIKGFFDNISHDLMMKAVKANTDCKWTTLYIERWLKAPVQLQDGSLMKRGAGTPQGGVISPLLANLFLHYAFDLWMSRTLPNNPFERYADDIVVHCRTQEEAKRIKNTISQRLLECKLEAHPDKTKIVFCKDSNKQADYPRVCFDFLGFSFRPRKVINKRGEIFTGFVPAISSKSKKRIGDAIRRWKLQKWTSYSEKEVARALNPVIRGWFNYYGSFHKSELSKLAVRLDFALMRWIRKKYKRYGSWRKSKRLLEKFRKEQPRLFVHWYLLSTRRTVGAV